MEFRKSIKEFVSEFSLTYVSFKVTTFIRLALIFWAVSALSQVFFQFSWNISYVDTIKFLGATMGLTEWIAFWLLVAIGIRR